MAQLTAEDLDSLSGKYEAPSVRGKQKTVTGFDTQQEAADFVKDALMLAGTGATFGFGEEALAGVQTGSFTSPEYKAQRDIYRGKIQKAREESPFLAPLIEAGSAEAVSTLLPGGRLAKGLATSALQGVGEAETMEQAPSEAAKSAGFQLAGEAAAGLLKATPMLDDPTKILTRSIGVGARELKGPEAKTAIGAVDRLNKVGFFKQGDVNINPNTQRFERMGIKKDLTGFLKPQTLDSLVERASKTTKVLVDHNKKLLKGKYIPEQEFQRTLYKSLQDMASPDQFNIEGRLEVARKIADVVEKDLKYATGRGGMKMIPAENILERKRALDKFLRDPDFDKMLTDLGVEKQSIMTVRKNLDNLLDNVGGNEFKMNNDLVSDLIEVEDIMRKKERRSYVDTDTRLIDTRSIMDKILEGISPTPVDIARADVSQAIRSKPGQFLERAAIRVPSERFIRDSGTYEVPMAPPEEQIPEVPQYDIRGPVGSGVLRNPSSIMGASAPLIDPMQVAKAKLPRTTEGLIQKKELVVAKLAQANVPPEMIKTFVQALNEDPEAVPGIASQLTSMAPQLFEKSKYNTFDGIISDPDEAAKAADQTSKRTDLDSIQKAKLINELNKNQRWLGE